jgi:hypothetical protein
MFVRESLRASSATTCGVWLINDSDKRSVVAESCCNVSELQNHQAFDLKKLTILPRCFPPLWSVSTGPGLRPCFQNAW